MPLVRFSLTRKLWSLKGNQKWSKVMFVVCVWRISIHFVSFSFQRFKFVARIIMIDDSVDRKSLNFRVRIFTFWNQQFREN